MLGQRPLVRHDIAHMANLEPNVAHPARQPQGSAGAPGVLRPGCLHLVRTTCIMLRMRLSARADYALRAAIELAASGEGHVTAEQLAKAQQIPAKFLEALLTQLRRAGAGRPPRWVRRRWLVGRPPKQRSPR